MVFKSVKLQIIVVVRMIGQAFKLFLATSAKAIVVCILINSF